MNDMTLIGLAGLATQLFCERLLPTVWPKFDRLTAQQKRLTVVIVAAVFVAAGMQLSCMGYLPYECPTSADALDVFSQTVQAVVVSQGVHLILKKD